MALAPVIKRKIAISSCENRKSSSLSDKQVHFELNELDLPAAIFEKYRQTHKCDALNEVLRAIADNKYSDDEVFWWISSLTEAVPHLDKSVDVLVFSLLDFNWYELKEEIFIKFEDFLVKLITVHSFYAYHVLKIIFSSLLPASCNDEGTPGEVSETEKQNYQRCISTIVKIHTALPNSGELVVVVAAKVLPYFLQSIHKHLIYARNLLTLGLQIPSIQGDLLHIVLSVMVSLDVIAPRSALLEESNSEDEDESDIFKMDSEKAEPLSQAAKSADSLDRLLLVVIQYIHNVCHGIRDDPFSDSVMKKCVVGSVKHSGDFSTGCMCGGALHNMEAIKVMYKHLKEVFVKLIMPTCGLAHVQLVLFYILGIRPGLVPLFLDYLRIQCFENPNCPRDIRKNAASYIGSLLSRGQFVPFSHVHSTLDLLSSWCHSYLNNQETVRVFKPSDIWLHAPFYFGCQTLFYVFTFRYRDYTHNKQRLKLAHSLNMEHLLLSPLNPLNVCSDALAMSFSVVTRRFQIAYCNTIIENNKRMAVLPYSLDSDQLADKRLLELFFPFDPCLLKRSKALFNGHYREFEGLPDDVDEQDDVEVMDMEEQKNSFCQFD